MVKLVRLICLILVLSGCTFMVAIDGQPYAVEVYPLSVEVNTPTPEVMSTPTATPGCVLSPAVPDYINLHRLPSGAIVTQFPDTHAVAEGYWQANEFSLKWYVFWYSDNSIPYAGNVWVAAVGSLNVTGDCESVPYVNPFLIE